MMRASRPARRLFLCQFGDWHHGNVCKSLFKRGDGVPEIVPACYQRPGEHRVSGIGAIEYPGTFLLDCDIAIEDPDEAIEIANHFADLCRFPRRGVAGPPKMTLVFHFAYSNCSASAQVSLGLACFRRLRKNLARGRLVGGFGLPIAPIAALLPQSFIAGTGTVKWFNATKGYGFIEPDGGGSKDVFVHISAVEKAGLNDLREGAKVTYDIISDRGKESAGNLRVQ
jgi:cold shock protein